MTCRSRTSKEVQDRKVLPVRSVKWIVQKRKKVLYQCSRFGIVEDRLVTQHGFQLARCLFVDANLRTEPRPCTELIVLVSEDDLLGRIIEDLPSSIDGTNGEVLRLHPEPSSRDQLLVHSVLR